MKKLQKPSRQGWPSSFLYFQMFSSGVSSLHPPLVFLPASCCQLQPQHPPSDTWEHAHSPCKGKDQLVVYSMWAECNCHAWDPWQLRVEGCLQGSTDSHASAASPGSRMNISSAAADRVATLITLIITTAQMLQSQSGRFRKHIE